MKTRVLALFVLSFPFSVRADLTGLWQGPGVIKISHGVGSSQDTLNCDTQLEIFHEKTAVLMKHLTFYCGPSEFKDGPFQFEISNGKLLKNGKHFGTISQDEMDIFQMKGSSLSSWNFKKSGTRIKATVHFVEPGFSAAITADLDKF